MRGSAYFLVPGTRCVVESPCGDVLRCSLVDRRSVLVGARLFGNADAQDEARKSGVGAQGVEPRVHLEIDHLIGALAKGFVERFESLVALAKTT